MDNERPNERTWSRRLEQPDALPGTGLIDKEAAWDKLYDRLKENVRKTDRRGNVARFPERSNDGRPSSDLLRHGPPRSGPSVLDNEPVVRFEDRPRRKRMIWLWAAAACVLLIVVPAALLLKDGHKRPRQDPQPIPVAVSSGKQQPAPQDKLSSHPPVAVNPRQSGRRREVDPGKGIGPANKESIDPDKEVVHARPKTPERATLTHLASGQSGRPGSAGRADPAMARPDLAQAGGQAHGADTMALVFAPRPDLSKPLTVAAAAPPKKEQRVVHINELEPSQPTPSTVKGPRQRPGGLHFGLTPRETYRPATTYAEPEAHSILLLKHPQNP